MGIAIASGTNVARESANIVLIGNDLSQFAEVVTIVPRCRRIIFWNFDDALHDAIFDVSHGGIPPLLSLPPTLFKVNS